MEFTAKRATPPTVQEMFRHVIEICQKCFVRWVETKDGVPIEVGFSDKDQRTIICKRVVSEATYAIALHELGHILHANGVLRYAGTPSEHNITLQILEEESAWEYAYYLALDWTLEMEATRKFAIGTYYTKRDNLQGQVKLEQEAAKRADKYIQEQRERLNKILRGR